MREGHMDYGRRDLATGRMRGSSGSVPCVCVGVRGCACAFVVRARLLCVRVCACACVRARNVLHVRVFACA